MLSEIQVKFWLSVILQIGIFLSIVLVLVGGAEFLWLHGSESLHSALISTTNYNINIVTIWQSQHIFSPLGLIELGLVVLVGAQVLRVALLVCYYSFIRDIWFIGFSLFILAVLLYSLIWQ